MGSGTAPDGGQRRQLDRAPGERYREPSGTGPAATGAAGEGPAGTAPGGTLPRALGAGVGTAAGAGVLYAVVGSFDLGAGLLALAAFAGWAVAVALTWGAAGRALRDRRGRVAIAAALGAGAIGFGFVLLWAWSRVEGGVLDPIGLLDQRFGGPFSALQVLVAAGAAGLRAWSPEGGGR